MKMQDKISADQVWVRNHSYHDKFIPNLTQGQHWPLFHAPNLEERSEMTYRTIGKLYDWDLEKFRADNKKADKGNKRRLMKNLARFCKNPVAYAYWKIGSRFRHTRVTVVIFAFLFFGYLNKYIGISHVNQARLEYLENCGADPQRSMLTANKFNQWRMPIPMAPLFHMIYIIPKKDWIVVNPTYKQNYRLYFDRQNFAA